MARETPVAIRRGGPETGESGRFVPTSAHVPLLRVVGGRGIEARDALLNWCRTFDPRLPVDGGTYRLMPMVFHRMQQWDVDHEIRPLLKGVYRRSFVENSRLVEGAAPAVQALDDRGLTPVLLKGAALVAGGHYPTLAARPMSDIDVYVTSADRTAAFAVLADIGWQLQLPPVDLRVYHAASFRAPDGVATLDLHWWPLKDVRGPKSERALLTNLVPAAGLDLAASVPDATAQLIITLVHGAEPNPEPPVRWAADALLLLAGADEVDWGRVVAFARNHQVGVRLRRMLVVLDSIVGGAVPQWVLHELNALRVWPIERWERRMMDADYASSTMFASKTLIVAFAAERTASTAAVWLRLLREYHESWQVPWPLMPAAAVARLFRRIGRR
ncbi:nucleotidyltransferase family protein [Mycobacterium sp. RTGN5]|uniref:nucleotidyltransferase family protein n=1 Tax=Mycobacterium sp. RTGN5 TaxID=3016522 RepID=UPI0029C61810|nr:nucleotidyltransferase family protein [Mycobacterium sp. RTGN5]